MTHFGIIVALLAGIAGMLVGVGGFIQWVFRRGMRWEQLVASIDTLTTAADRLSSAFDVFAKNTQEQLTTLEHRIFKLESKD